MNSVNGHGRRNIYGVLLGCSILGLASAAVAASLLRLSINGASVSTSVRIMDGRAYVPLDDVARVMHGTLVKKDEGYEISTTGATRSGDAPGGANQVQGMNGKVGQTLFSGKWRFQVLDVTRAAHYESRFLPDKRTFDPKGDTEELVIVNCSLKNGMKEQAKAMLSQVHPHHIALTDNQGQSYPPMDFDKHTDSTDESPNLLPGASTDFAVIFSVPKGITLNDLVFSLQRAYEDTPDGGADARISLVP